MKRPGLAFNEASGTRAVNEATGAARLMKSTVRRGAALLCSSNFQACRVVRSFIKLLESRILDCARGFNWKGEGAQSLR